ncbi:MAG: DUF3846 domain-containing protein [Dehalococcoidia bacterium]|nr:DUF3846 domain-containing protein [Dehalococcoidia bacterium]
MKVLIVEPQKAPYEAEIGDKLEDLQNVVGGYIEAICPFEEAVALVCNEDSKFKELPLNRVLYDKKGNACDVVAGTFFVCGIDGEDFCSLSPELMDKYKREFAELAAIPAKGE